MPLSALIVILLISSLLYHRLISTEKWNSELEVMAFFRNIPGVLSEVVEIDTGG